MWKPFVLEIMISERGITLKSKHHGMHTAPETYVLRWAVDQLPAGARSCPAMRSLAHPFIHWFILSPFNNCWVLGEPQWERCRFALWLQGPSPQARMLEEQPTSVLRSWETCVMVLALFVTHDSGKSPLSGVQFFPLEDGRTGPSHHLKQLCS